jgi:Haem-NO-binding
VKGIVFNLLEEVVATRFGEEAWDEMLGHTGLGGAYTSLGNYPDSEFTTLLAALSRRIGETERDVLRWFGRNSMPRLAERYAEFFRGHRGLRTFLLSLNDVIHSEVRKLYPGAEVPNFEFETPEGAKEHEALLIHYRSERRLCLLAEGFILGAADQFNERVDVRQEQCMLDGARECRIVCRFQGPR